MAELGGLKVVGSLPSGAPGETVVCAFPSPSGGFLPVLVRRVIHAGSPPGSDHVAGQLRRAGLVRNHNVVQVVDVVQDGAGVAGVYAAFPGITLAVLLREAAITATPIPGPLAVHLVTEICKGLHAIHEATDGNGTLLDLLHTDLTPDAVWISWEGDVRVMDLGLANPSVQARAMEGNESRVWFISPELARGGAADRRSDVYSAAAILYRLVTGRPPYSGTTAVETVKLIVETPLPDARSVAPMLPPALGDMLSTGMAKNPAERFQSASAFGSTLQRFLDLARLTAVPAELGAFLTRLMPEGHPLRTAWTAPVLQAFDAGPSSTTAVMSAVPAVDLGLPVRRATLPMSMMSANNLPPAVEQAVSVEEELSLSAMADRARSAPPSGPLFGAGEVEQGFGEEPITQGGAALTLEPVDGLADEPFFGGEAIALPGHSAPPEAIALPGAPPEAIALPGGRHDSAPAGIALPGRSHGPRSVDTLVGGLPASEAIALPGSSHPPAMPGRPAISSPPPTPNPNPTQPPRAPAPDFFDSVPPLTPAQPLDGADGLSGPPRMTGSTLPPGISSPAMSLVPEGGDVSMDPEPPKKGGKGVLVGGAVAMAAAAAAWFFLLGPGAEPASPEDEPPVVAKDPAEKMPDPVAKAPDPAAPVEKVPDPVEKTPEPPPPPSGDKAPDPVAKAPDPPPPVENTPDPVAKAPEPPPPPPQVEKAPDPAARPAAPLKFPAGMGALAVTAPTGSSIFINGKKMPFTTPVDPLFLRPGSYRLKVSAPGGKPQAKRTVEITEKNVSDMVLEAPEAAAEQEAPPPPPPPPPRKQAAEKDEGEKPADDAEEAPRKKSSRRAPPPPPPPP